MVAPFSSQSIGEEVVFLYVFIHEPGQKKKKKNSLEVWCVALETMATAQFELDMSLWETVRVKTKVSLHTH